MCHCHTWWRSLNQLEQTQHRSPEKFCSTSLVLSPIPFFRSPFLSFENIKNLSPDQESEGINERVRQLEKWLNTFRPPHLRRPHGISCDRLWVAGMRDVLCSQLNAKGEKRPQVEKCLCPTPQKNDAVHLGWLYSTDGWPHRCTKCDCAYFHCEMTWEWADKMEEGSGGVGQRWGERGRERTEGWRQHDLRRWSIQFEIV